MSTNTAIFTDFAGVLTEPLADTFARFYASTGITQATLAAAIKAVRGPRGTRGMEPIDTGLMSENDWSELLATNIFRDTGLDYDLSDFGRRLWFPGRQRNEQMLAWLSDRRDEGAKIVMLSNNVKEWYPLWTQMIPEHLDLFDAVVNSCDTGFRKPDNAAYAAAISQLGSLADGTVPIFIDDMAENVSAARHLGWHGVQYTSMAACADELNTALAEAGSPDSARAS